MVRLLTVLTCVAACGGLCASERSTPRFQGDSLPVPPQQSAPWTSPKTRLSSRLIAATRTLFAQGLADPRGCAYREIETGEGEGRYDVDERGVFKSHGWVLPADAARPQRFAVRWDGLVYPVLTIGPAANLRAYVTQTIEAKGQNFEERDGYLIRLCLLLRLGESRLAEEYFDHLIAEDEDLWDPYLILAQEWTRSLFTRAVHAHMRGDDRLSLLTARALIPIWEAVEVEATELDLPRHESQASGDNSPGEIPRYLEELKPIRVILADQERRAAERRLKKDAPLRLDDLDYSSIENPKDFRDQVEGKLGRQLDNGQRIALVIGWFEETSQPVDWLANYLRPYRDEAVEPLLNCLENDTRLSRGGEFAQDGFRPEGVDQIAYHVLCGILETHFDAYSVGELTRQDRKAIVERIRAHWHKIRNMSSADGWYEILRDDSQSPDRWVEAVKRTIAYGGPTVGEAKERAARRETMRKKRNPSMTELLVKRARSLAEQGSMHQASLLALAIADWEPKAALPILRQQTTRWREVLPEQDPEKNHRIRWIPSDLVQLTLARARPKDASALPEYIQILREMSPPEEPYRGEDVFQPLLQYPDAPEVVAAAQWIFNDATSPWNATTHLIHVVPSLGRNKLMILPAFHKLVLRTLADTQVVGAAEVRSYDDIHIAAIGYNTRTFAGDPLCPAPATRVDVRRCDVCAWQLAEIYGMPRCELYWPKARRDQAVAQCSRLLQQYGRLLGKTGRHLGPWAVGFAFPLLDHSATPEDVRDGRAIFSLKGQGTVRCCNLLQRPAPARWVAFREEPFLAWDYDEEKKRAVPRVNYHQEGVVWQADEVEVGGKWHRYYGFAGAGRMAKVAAEEIEFDVPGERWDDAFNVELEFWLPSLNLVNRSGLPQPVPHFHSADDPTPAPPSSTVLDFRLYRFVGADDELSWDASPDFPDHTRGEDRQWREIPRKLTARLRIEQLPAQLQPMEAIPLFTVKLDVDYPKLAPGYYRAVASLTTTGNGPKRILRLLQRGHTHIRSDSRDP